MIRRHSRLVYHFEWQSLHGETLIVRGSAFAYQATKLVSASLIVAGIVGLFFTFQPVISSELTYRLSQLRGQPQQEIQQAEAITVDASNLEREQTKILASELGVPNTSFSIYIPKIDARAPVVENVDPSRPSEYLKALKQGVAHAKGTVFPGVSGGTFLFAHSSDLLGSTNYNTVFYLLRELEPSTDGRKGDEIYVFFLDKLYKYRVIEKHVVAAEDTSWINNAKQGQERLILQTCWPPGTALKRLIVVAEPVKD